MNNLAYKNRKSIRRPKPTKKKQYKLDKVGLLVDIKKMQNRLKIEIGKYKADLLLLKKDESDVESEANKCKEERIILENREKDLKIRKGIVNARPASMRKAQELTHLEGTLREIRTEKATELQRIRYCESILLKLKRQKKSIKKNIKEKKQINMIANVAKFLLGAASAAEFVSRHKIKIAIAALAIAGAVSILPKNEEIQGLPEGNRNHEIVMEEDKTNEDLGNGFKDSIKVETPDPKVNAPVENEQEEMSLSEEELFGIFIENFEGNCSLKVYDLGDGVLTMGWGHTEPHGGEYQVGDTITIEQAVEFLKEDREWAYSEVDRHSR